MAKAQYVKNGIAPGHSNQTWRIKNQDLLMASIIISRNGKTRHGNVLLSQQLLAVVRAHVAIRILGSQVTRFSILMLPEDWNGFMQNSARFYHMQRHKNTYKQAIKQVITRVNSINGVPYNQDPTIMTWSSLIEA